MAKLRFDANVPVECALKFSEGKLSPSTFKDAEGNPYPDQMFYTLCGDDTMYVPLIVADQITKLGIKKLELISIVKRVQGKVTRWLVQRVGDTATVAINEPPPNCFDDIPTAIDATPLERQLTTSINQAQQRTPTLSKVTPAVAAVQTRVENAPQTDLTPNVAGHTRASAVMAAALVASIDALIVGEQYAKAKGKTLQFNETEVWACAATIFIQAAKDPLFSERVPTQKVNGGTTWPRQ